MGERVEREVALFGAAEDVHVYIHCTCTYMYMYMYVHVHVCNILVLHKYALFFHFQKQELAGGAKAARIYRDEVETLKVQV